MKAGENNIDSVIRTVLVQFPEVKLAIIFGSAGVNQLHSGSDVDLAVAADAPLTAETRFRLMGELASKFGRPVDLLDLQATSGPIVGEILRGRIILKNDLLILSRLMRKVWEWEADIAPTWRATVRERNVRIFGK